LAPWPAIPHEGNRQLRSKIMVGAAAFLLSWPAAAQQPAPQTPPPTGQAAPSGPMGGPGAGGMPMMGGRGPGGMGMGMGMAGRPPMGDMDEDGDRDDDGRRMRGWRHHGGGDTPMQVIINIGPSNRVEVEDQEGRRYGERGRMGPRAMRQGWAARPAEMVERRLDYLRNALQLRQDQQAAWDRFAGAVRDATGRMRQWRMEAMAPVQGLDQRISEYEQALNSRLEAVRTVRTALSELTQALDETQRRTLNESAEAFMPGMGGMRAYGR
jgi:hypothetical protein